MEARRPTETQKDNRCSIGLFFTVEEAIIKKKKKPFQKNFFVKLPFDLGRHDKQYDL